MPLTLVVLMYYAIASYRKYIIIAIITNIVYIMLIDHKIGAVFLVNEDG